MALNFFDLLVLLGSIQGFIISGLLFFGGKKQQRDRILSALLLILAMASLNIYLIGQDWFQKSTLLQILHEILPLVIIMPAGPLIYFYTRSCLDPDFKLSKKHRRYFYPVVLDLFQHLVVIFYIVILAIGLVKPGNPAWGKFIDDYNTYVDIPRWFSISIYLWLSWKYIGSTEIKQQASVETTKLTFRWPKQLITGFIIFQLIWLFHLIPYAIPRFSEQWLNWVNWYPIFVPMAILIYWLSFKGLLYARLEQSGQKKSRGIYLAMSEEMIREAGQILKKSMETDRLYLEPDLSLKRLSSHTGLPPKTISAVLNQYLNKNFSDFVNEYRIAEIKEKILQADHRRFTISGIAYDCGFNSQPTFHRAFKAATGITPKEFLSRHVQIQD